MGKGQPKIGLVLIQNGKIVDKTVTGAEGKYSFKARPGIFPFQKKMYATSGKYEVSTSDSTDACIGRRAVQVEVVDKPITVEPSLSVSGYALSVSVKNNGKGVSGVPITIYSAHNKVCLSFLSYASYSAHKLCSSKVAHKRSLVLLFNWKVFFRWFSSNSLCSLRKISS